MCRKCASPCEPGLGAKNPATLSDLAFATGKSDPNVIMVTDITLGERVYFTERIRRRPRRRGGFP